MGGSEFRYVLKSGFQNEFDCHWNKLDRWREGCEFSKRTFASLNKGGVPAKHLRSYLDFLADYVADTVSIRLIYSDMVEGSALSWFGQQAGSKDTINRTDLQPYKRSCSVSVTAPDAENSLPQNRDCDSSDDGDVQQDAVLSLGSRGLAEVLVENEEKSELALQSLNQPPSIANRHRGSYSPNKPVKLLPSPRRPENLWLIVTIGMAAVFIAAVVVIGTTARTNNAGGQANYGGVRGMVYIENVPVQAGTIRILRTGRSDNLRVISSKNPGYFEFPQLETHEARHEFRIDIDQPLDMAPVVISNPVNDDRTPVDIHLNIQPKSIYFPRKRYKDISPLNDNVPPLNRMAILAYVGRDDEANRLADEIEQKIFQLSDKEKYEFFTRRGFCHWQANEFKQAATYYSQAMDHSTSDARHVVLAAESVLHSAAGIYFTEELQTAQGWIDACREEISRTQHASSAAGQIHILDITGGKLAAAMGNFAHGKNLMVQSFSKIQDSENVDLETRFSTCLDLITMMLITKDHSAAQRYVDQARNMVHEFPDDTRRKTWAGKVADGLAAIYELDIGRLTAVESRLTSAIEFVQQQYPESPEFAFVFLEARSRLYQAQLKNELAIKDILQCINWASSQRELSFSNERDLAIWSERYSRILIQQAERSASPAVGYSEALQNIEKSLAWAELQQPRESRLLNSFRATKSNVFFMQNKLDEALTLIDAAIEWASQTAGSESLVFAWKAQRAPIYSYLARRTKPFDKTMLEQAIDDYSTCIENFRNSTEDDRELAICLSAKSRIHQMLSSVDTANRKQHLDSALADINESIARFERVFTDGGGSVYIYIGLKATILSDIDQPKEAREVLDRALQLFEESSQKSPAERMMLQRFEQMLKPIDKAD